MKVTWEEMDAARLTTGERGYCAHLIMAYKRCQVRLKDIDGLICLFVFSVNMLRLLDTIATLPDMNMISVNTKTFLCE